MKIKVLCKTWLYFVDFATKIDERFNEMLVELIKVLDAWDLLEFGNRLV